MISYESRPQAIYVYDLTVISSLSLKVVVTDCKFK